MMAYQPLEYDARTAQCRASGHDLVLWRMHVDGTVNLRQLCRVCGRTFLCREAAAEAA